MVPDSGSMHAHYAVLCRLSNPTATLYGYDANNTGHAIVLSLASPSASPADKVRRPLATSLLCTHYMSRLLYTPLTSTPAGISEVAGFLMASGYWAYTAKMVSNAGLHACLMYVDLRCLTLW